MCNFAIRSELRKQHLETEKYPSVSHYTRLYERYSIKRQRDYKLRKNTPSAFPHVKRFYWRIVSAEVIYENLSFRALQINVFSSSLVSSRKENLRTVIVASES